VSSFHILNGYTRTHKQNELEKNLIEYDTILQKHNTCICGFLLVHYPMETQGSKGFLRLNAKFPTLVKSGGYHGKNINYTIIKC